MDKATQAKITAALEDYLPEYTYIVVAFKKNSDKLEFLGNMKKIVTSDFFQEISTRLKEIESKKN